MAMRRDRCAAKLLRGALLLCIISVSTAAIALGQFTQNATTVKLDPSVYPTAVLKGLALFKVKCNACHSLDLSMKMNLSADRWASEVKRMEAMASSRFNDQEARAIVEFLVEAQKHREQPITLQTTPGSDAVSAGQTLYYAQSCDACHAIGGRGGDGGPPLDDLGKRLTREEILHSVRDRKSDVMPPLPPATTDAEISALVEFLFTLRGK